MAHRTRLFALILILAAPCAHAQDAKDAQDSVTTGTQPSMVKVTDVTLVDESATKGPIAAFGIVNPSSGACYAVALPAGASIEAGDTYALVPKADVDDALRKDVAAKYPKCSIVDAVARVARDVH